MTYLAIAQMANDQHLRSRILGCLGLEGDPHPEYTVQQMIWKIVARTDWAAAWDSALAAGTPLDGLGANPGVITDQMILSAVQAVR